MEVTSHKLIQHVEFCVPSQWHESSAVNLQSASQWSI